MKIINFPGSGKQGKRPPTKEFLGSELIENIIVGPDLCRLRFSWHGPAPQAGQFFMIKPERTRVFLGRPISVALWDKSKKIVDFLIALRGEGTIDISNMFPGELAELTGPLGNTWVKFLSAKPDSKKPLGLIGGGIGVAPLQALVMEIPNHSVDFLAGFKTGFANDEERIGVFGPVASFKNSKIQQTAGADDRLIIATEDGSEGFKGRITDFLEPEKYAAVCACGPAPMLRAVAEKCRAANVSCYISTEERMACGIGACLGCTVKTVHGNRRCCADGPIFPAEELCFDE